MTHNTNNNKYPMLSRILTLLIILQTISSLTNSSIIPPPPLFNLSHFLYPKVTTFTQSNIPQEPPNFLQGVLDAIAKKEKWTLEDIRISELHVKKAKYRSVQIYEFRVGIGKTEIVLKMHDELSEWKKLVDLGGNGSSNFEALARKIGSKAVIDSLKIEGPFELQVSGDDDQLSLMLPLSTSHSGLRRISVGEGIYVEVKGAKEISIFHPSELHHPIPYGVFSPYTKSNKNESIWPGLCSRLLPNVRVLGSASAVAYRKQRPTSLIQTVFSSESAIKLLPDKCYIWPNRPRDIFNSLSILRSFLNKTGNQNSLKSRIRASTIFQFQLELERDVRSNDHYWSTLADWRTRPIIERVSFEIVGKIEGEIMKPILIKKVRPFIDTDSFAWNGLLSNISFTKFPSGLVPPEALTLDVKW